MINLSSSSLPARFVIHGCFHDLFSSDCFIRECVCHTRSLTIESVEASDSQSAQMSEINKCLANAKRPCDCRVTVCEIQKARVNGGLNYDCLKPLTDPHHMVSK